MVATGEKLSKHQLKHETTIKKLRATAKETEATMSQLQTQLANERATIARQAEELKAAEKAKGLSRTGAPVIGAACR